MNIFLFLALLNLLCILIALTKWGRTPTMTALRMFIGISTVLFCLIHLLVRAAA